MSDRSGDPAEVEGPPEALAERPAEPQADGRPAARTDLDEVRLARIHLRLGMLSMARAELEDLERRGALGAREQAVLAEARWRTGEPSAVAAAGSHLEAGGQDPVAIAIAVEAAAAEGRPADARRLMDRLADLDATQIDTLFGGMPQRAFWPSVPGATAIQALVDEADGAADSAADDRAAGAPGRGASSREEALAAAEMAAADEAAARAGRRSLARGAAAGPDGRPVGGAGPSIPGPHAVLASTSPSLWAGSSPESEQPETAREGVRGDERVDPASRQVEHTDPLAELARARAELAVDPDRGLLRLALVLRADPTLAPSVLDALSMRKETAAAIIRGDAERLLGRQLEAEAAFSAAGNALDRSDRPEAR